MKKILLILFIFMLGLQCFATSNEAFSKCSALVEKAQKGYNLDNAIAALECNYKLDKSSLSADEKSNLNNEILKNLVNFNLMRHETTQDKKYIKAAYKYSFDAIKNNTKNIDTVKIAISLASAELNPEKMIKAYDYLCLIDPKQGQKEKENFIKKISEVREIKSKQAELRRLQYANVLSNIEIPQNVYGASRYNSTQINCSQSGNNVYCNTYEY